MKTITTALALTALIGSPVFAAPVTYNIDPTHTHVIASWSHFGFSNPKAAIDGAKGTIVFDEKAPTKSSVDVSVSIDTINTFVPELTAEFLGGDYFMAEEYPLATFTSTKVTSKGDGTYAVEGELTIKGVTKTVTLDTTLNGKGTHPMTQKPAIGFDAKTVIKRSDFGLDQYVPHVGDEVTLTITAEAQAN